VRILLTGASSFTGYWFAHALAAAGHHVVAPLQRAQDAYSGVRGERVARLARVAEIVWCAPFGEPGFISLLDASFDVLCHHAAVVTDYRSPDFDVAAALRENTRNFQPIVRAMSAKGLRAVVLTGSVFEEGEGAGEPPLRSFSPYGVSKSATASVVRYWCQAFGVPLGKFVIPNPFGPLEEPRFSNYLVNTWRKGEIAQVRTPRYIRDNIHVTLLAKAYRSFVDSLANEAGPDRFGPSGYVETQGDFALRCARELGPRLGLQARVELLEQTDFSEPLMRVNTQPLDGRALSWSEARSWDELADFYGPNSSS
jgi:UDP-glucose 4-epimerase